LDQVSFNSWSVFLICWSLLHLGSFTVNLTDIEVWWMFQVEFQDLCAFSFMTFNKNDIYVYTYAYMFHIVVGLLLCVFYVGIICYQNWHVFVETCWICLESICAYLILPFHFKFAKGKMSWKYFIWFFPLTIILFEFAKGKIVYTFVACSFCIHFMFVNNMRNFDWLYYLNYYFYFINEIK
jgi:hypothetical protein